MKTIKEAIEEISERPTDMLERQLAAYRAAARYRHPVTRRRHFAHLPLYRASFVISILAMRKILMKRRKEVCQ